jgi:hypothetical protein
VYSNTFTVNVDVSFTVLTLRSTAGTGITAGGSFNFNTAGVTGTVTSSSPLVPGATNLVQVTATTGTVTISLGGNVAPRTASNDVLILYSGNCNLNLTGTNFNGAVNAGNAYCINKSSSGTITINGNIIASTSGINAGSHTFLSTSGNSIINGNVTGSNQVQIGGSVFAISQNAGSLVVNGSVTGGSNSPGNGTTISFFGNSLTINGNASGGTGTNSAAISSSAFVNTITGTVTGNASVAFITSGVTNTITGNVTGGTNVSAISSSSANIINVTGTVTASATSQAISMTNASGQVYLNGNMVNNNGKMAIYAPIVWLDANNTTSAAFFTSGGSPRTLYSEDTFPNMPAVNNVRSGTIYGAGNTLVGTIVMPTAANVRSGVVYDNGTTGTALFTTSLFLTELSSSTVPVAVRMQNLCTPMILGELMEAYKK